MEHLSSAGLCLSSLQAATTTITTVKMKAIPLIIMTIVASSLFPPVKVCKDHVVDQVYRRLNSYTGNKFLIPGPELCKNSMILECKELKLSKLNLENLTFSDVLPMEGSLNLKDEFPLKVKKGEPIDGDPNLPPRTTVISLGVPVHFYESPFRIDGLISFSRQGDPREFAEKFTATRVKSNFEMQLTCLNESLDKLDTLYVELKSAEWIIQFAGCTSIDLRICREVEKIVRTKVTNSFTVALAKLIDQIGTTGQPGRF